MQMNLHRNRAAKNIEDRIANAWSCAKQHTKKLSFKRAFEEYAIECIYLKVAVSEDVQNCNWWRNSNIWGYGFSADTPMESAFGEMRRIARNIWRYQKKLTECYAVGMLVKSNEGYVDTFLGPLLKVRWRINGNSVFWYRQTFLLKLFGRGKDL